MTGSEGDDLRADLKAFEDEVSTDDESRLVAYLEHLDEEWGSSLGISEATVRFLSETEERTATSGDFEDRLVETMRRAHRIRECASESNAVLDASATFGAALARMIQGSRSAAGEDGPELGGVESARTPFEVGATRLARLVREYGLELLQVVSLVGEALEREYVAKRATLLAQGLARSDQEMSEREQREQALNVASAFLKPKREQSISFLEEFVRATQTAE